MPPEAEEKTLRETLERAYDEEVKDEDGAEQPGLETAPVPDAEGDGPIEELPESPAVPGKDAAEEQEEAGAEPKFLPPEGAEQGEGDKPEGGDSGQPPEPAERVPVGWRGAAKDVWAQVPEEARQEIVRREKEVNTVLRDSSQARQFQEQFERTVAPFQQYWVADGTDPLTATRNLMQTAASLRMGSPQQKAQTVAQIVQQFGVDVAALDDALVNGGGAAPVNGGAGLGPDAQAYINQQLAPVNQFMQGLQQRAQRQETEQRQSVSEEIDAFEQNPKYTYYEDVREDMADLLEIASRRGQEMSLEQAYDKAISMNPKLSGLMRKKQEAEAAKRSNESLEQKKRAAASLQTTSVPPATPKPPKDLRGALEAAWDKHSGGGL